MTIKDNRKEPFLNDEFISENMLIEFAEYIDSEIEKDILNHQKIDVEISEDFDKRMLAEARKIDREINKSYRHEFWKKISRIAAVLLICIISMGTLGVVTSEALRYKIINIFTDNQTGSVSIDNSDEEELVKGWNHYWYPTKLPEGFHIETTEESDHFIVFYNNETKDEFYIYEQDKDSSLSIDTDSSHGELIKVGYSQGYLFQLDDNQSFGVTWFTDNLLIIMCFEGNWNKEKIMDIIEHLDYIVK